MQSQYEFFMEWHNAVITYYIIMWVLNTVAYGFAAIGFTRWIRILDDIKFVKTFKRFRLMCLVFGVLRFGSGLIATVRFILGDADWLTSLETFGVVSLLTNTTFALMMAWLITGEAKRLETLSPEKRHTLLNTLLTFAQLREIVRNPEPTFATRVLDEDNEPERVTRRRNP
jgi:hypothetical protein